MMMGRRGREGEEGREGGSNLISGRIEMLQQKRASDIGELEYVNPVRSGLSEVMDIYYFSDLAGRIFVHSWRSAGRRVGMPPNYFFSLGSGSSVSEFFDSYVSYCLVCERSGLLGAVDTV